MRKGIYNILVIMALLSVVGCSNDSTDDFDTTSTSQEGETSYAPLRMVGIRRATLGETEWYDIHTFLTNGTTLTEGKFKYASDTEEWSTPLAVVLSGGMRFKW